MNDPVKLPTTTKIDSFFIRKKMAVSKGAAIDIGDGLYGFLSNWPDEVRKIIKADESRNHTVYIHLLPTSIYIGQTSTKPEDRWRRGEGYRDNKLFYTNIKKYGWDNIKHKVLTSHLTKDEADIVESSLIRYFSNHEKETGLTVLNLTLNERSGETNVISHVKEIIDYAEEFESLKCRCGELEAENRELEAENRELKEKLERYEAENRELEAENREIKDLMEHKDTFRTNLLAII